jgi:hypothetical protein
MATNPSTQQSGGTQTPTGSSGVTPIASQKFATATESNNFTYRTGGLKQWPKGLTTQYPDYMEFNAFKYVSYADYYTQTGVSLTSGSSATATPQSGTTSSTTNTPTPSSTSGQSGQATSATTKIDFAGRPTANQRFIKGESLDTLRLPIPNSIQFSDGPKWSTEDIGIVGTQLGAAVKGLQGGQDVASNLQKMATGLQSQIALDAIAGMNFFGSKNAITQNIGGKIQNPYTEQIFNGVDPRSFTFNWKLVPRNIEEQTAINDMIKAFRYNSLPDYSSELNSGSSDVNAANLSDRWLTVPSVWSIKFFSYGKDMKYIPYLKVCVIQNISVNYTPDNVWASHMTPDGPAPVAYDFSVQFQEVEIITSSEVKNGGY